MATEEISESPTATADHPNPAVDPRLGLDRSWTGRFGFARTARRHDLSRRRRRSFISQPDVSFQSALPASPLAGGMD